MRRGKGTWSQILLTLLALGLWIGAVTAAQRAGELAAGAEAAWENGGVSPAQVEKARRWAKEDGKADQPALSLWREEQDAAVQTGDGEKQASCRALFLYGDGALVWPAQFLGGSYPCSGEERGVAISSALADALWGSVEVLGQTLTLKGVSCRVWGVFREDSLLLLTQDTPDSEALYDHMVIPTDGGGVESARDLLNRYGFYGAALTDLPLFTWALTALAGLPGLALGLGLLLRLFRRGYLLRRSPALLARYLPPALAGACAVLWAMGPAESIPGRLLPTRWSDFDFWTALAGELRKEVGAVFSHAPFLRELRFWGMAGACLLLSLGALALIILWGERAKPSSLAGWWWGCVFVLGCVFAFAMAVKDGGGVTVPRGLWLLPGLKLTAEGYLLLHKKSLCPEERREDHEEAENGAERGEISAW